MLNIDEIWKRIKDHEGEVFETKSGKHLKYEIDGEILHPSRTKRNIHKKNFEKCLEHLPLEGPGEISNSIQGPSYVWAILHDKRIRKTEW